MDIVVKLKLLNDSASVPQYATAGSAASDIRACTASPLTLHPRETATVSAGFAIAVPEGYAAFVFSRSGLASRHGVILANGVAVIDSDYRGELKLPLYNNSDSPYTVHPGDRIAQLAVLPVCRAAFELCDALDETKRGEGGFGSTGNN